MLNADTLNIIHKIIRTCCWIFMSRRALVISLQNGSFLWFRCVFKRFTSHNFILFLVLLFSSSFTIGTAMHFNMHIDQIVFNKWYFFAIITSFISATHSTKTNNTNKMWKKSLHFFSSLHHIHFASLYALYFTSYSLLILFYFHSLIHSIVLFSSHLTNSFYLSFVRKSVIAHLHSSHLCVQHKYIYIYTCSYSTA